MKRLRLALLALVLGSCTALGPPAREVIFTPDAPRPIGPYSQAIRVGDRLYLAGQIGIDPERNELVSGGAANQARQALRNLEAVLHAAGFAPADVVECEIFLTDLDNFADVNAIYAELFRSDPPARATVQVARLPKDAQVEIRMSAERSGS